MRIHCFIPAFIKIRFQISHELIIRIEHLNEFQRDPVKGFPTVRGSVRSDIKIFPRIVSDQIKPVPPFCPKLNTLASVGIGLKIEIVTGPPEFEEKFKTAVLMYR